MRSIIILILAAMLMSACGGAGATSQPSPTPTLTPTPTVWAEATATAQAAVTATAQAQTTATAQAQATTTAQARAQAATATALAQRTATAQAQASATTAAGATKTALLAFIDALVQKVGDKPYKLHNEKLAAPQTQFYTTLSLKNFVADAEFTNPADPAVHRWDYGFRFRFVGTDKYYTFILISDGTWRLNYPEKALADVIQVKSWGGKVGKMDLTPTGSNKVRLVVNENAAYLFVNGEFVTVLDVSTYNSGGSLFIGTAFMQGDDFPGLSVTVIDAVINGLP
jgi:hypothetical protein